MSGFNVRDVLVETAAVAMLRRKGNNRGWREVRLAEVVDACGGGTWSHWLTPRGQTAMRVLVPAVTRAEDLTVGHLVAQAQKA
ncbi:MAG: hypothetical protein A3J66_02010 [Candidatus Magasanikbacteria bacterium RIFCSPHIGHO2_02_FULL_47_14]|uniref:Uncharacterized protein n=1 Tax=Candidatus Magasanikbacteria bacterium RIFCSPHIGHO2_02_FULL_47_14 TaxID=1798680 RepID=A0A1F6MAZ8_9BACT|nr:MAG: hypothetical protein A3J66_02010 [Candidatus Magasanikbacteria bacterium RIFCSPHIGHO2_02_FULL_47_14]